MTCLEAECLLHSWPSLPQLGDSDVIVRYLTRTFFAPDGARVGPIAVIPEGGLHMPLLKPAMALAPADSARNTALRHMIEDFSYPASLMYT